MVGSYDSGGILEASPLGADVDVVEEVASYPLHPDTCPLHAFPLELAAAVAVAAAVAAEVCEPAGRG